MAQTFHSTLLLCLTRASPKVLKMQYSSTCIGQRACTEEVLGIAVQNDQ